MLHTHTHTHQKNADHEDDVFDSSPFKKRRIPLSPMQDKDADKENQMTPSLKKARQEMFKPPSATDSDNSESNDEEEGNGSPGQQRRSPEILRSFDHTSMDSYINKFAQRQRQGSRKSVFPAAPPTITTTTTVKQTGGGDALRQVLKGRGSHLFEEKTHEAECFSDSDNEDGSDSNWDSD